MVFSILFYAFIITSLFQSTIQLGSSRFKSYQEHSVDNIENIELPDAALSKISQIFYNVSLRENENMNKLIKLNFKIKKRSVINYPNSANKESLEIHRKAMISLETTKILISNVPKAQLNDQFNLVKNLPVPQPYCPNNNQACCDSNYPYRSYDGSCNNLINTWWGRSLTPYKRLLRPAYDDEINLPRTKSIHNSEKLPSSRLIAMKTLEPNPTESMAASSFIYFGQFVSHDLALTPDTNYNCDCNTTSSNCFNIQIPYGDGNFSSYKCIPFIRSSTSTQTFSCNLGHREQITKRTHFLDNDNVYSTNYKDSKELRYGYKGLLKTSQIPGSFYESLPRKTSEYCDNPARIGCFFAGDERLEENTFLTAMHTLFLREHNRIAKALHKINRHWIDEKLFQEARRIINAQYQHIIYNEFLPILIGDKLMNEFELYPLKIGYLNKYDSSIYPQVYNEFATAAYRLHNLVHNEVHKAYKNLNDYEPKELRESIFNTSDAFNNLDDIARGTLIETTYKHFPQLADTLHNHLFEDLFGPGKTSLSALNIQRGRDHGIAPYNNYRKLCGLNLATKFDDLKNNMEANVILKLKKAYRQASDIDLFVGGVSENQIEGGFTGHTFACIIARQYYDLKFSDRFYYENGENKHTRFSLEQLNEIRKSTIAKLYCNNLDIEYIQKKAFFRKSDTNPKVNCSSIDDVNLNLWAENSKLKIELLGVLNVYNPDHINNLTDKIRGLGKNRDNTSKKKEYYPNPYNSKTNGEFNF